MSKRILVTGGCGFVGASLSKRLVKAGHEVAILDNLSVGTRENLDPQIINDVNLMVTDVVDSDKVQRNVMQFRPDSVFHLAAMHFIPDCNANPTSAIRTNVEGTQSVLDACRAADVPSVVITSSAAVYKPDDKAHQESSTVTPTDIYGYTKWWDEHLAQLFHQTSGTPVKIARLFNVFGPGETNLHLVPAILRQIEDGDDLFLGNLSTKRDYVFVDDVAEAFVKLEEYQTDQGVTVCNVGSEVELDGYEVVGTLGRLLNRHLTIHTDPSRMRPSDRPHLLSDCSFAHTEIGWTAHVSFEDGLREAMLRPMGQGHATRVNGLEKL